ncbi:MAG: glycosyltransferase [Ignavibacteria bacterium]|nr:glycosyltransferase [Ignavibacteria bacterium]
MSKIDLHLHSKFSEPPDHWLMKKFSALECYTEIEDVFQIAQQRGMDFVTITDHNRIDGALKLKEKYPNKVIIGVESAVKFPDSGHSIDLLLYGITEKQFEEIQLLRKDVYEMRDYVKCENIAYSVAHPTFSENGKLSIEDLEKLILLFDVFEGRNGGRIKIHNDVWIDGMINLTPEKIEDLYSKYKIEPISDTPWIKGFTGGSDDHSGLFIGTTYTLIPDAKSTDDVLKAIREKRTIPFGSHNDFKRLLFTALKVFFEYLKDKELIRHEKLFHKFFKKYLIGNSQKSFVDNLYLQLLQISSKFVRDEIKHELFKLAQAVIENSNLDINSKFEIIYDKLSSFFDKKISVVFEPFIKINNSTSIIKSIESSYLNLPNILFTAPFIFTFHHLNKGRNLIEEFSNKYCPQINERKKVLWFTDTFNDLNGVSTTLNELLTQSYINKENLHIVISVDEKKIKNDLPENVINIPLIEKFNLPYYESYELSIPSLFKALNILSKHSPDVVYISTPGPVGLLGLLMAKIYNIEVRGVYHTDFKLQVEAITGDYELAEIVDKYVNWFYSQCDYVESPSHFYLNVLKERNVKTHLTVFRRSINLTKFSPKYGRDYEIKSPYQIKDGINLLYSGRISKDKNLDFLFELYLKSINKFPDLNLIIVGDGPYLEKLKSKYQTNKRIVFTGGVEHSQLPEIYSIADVFLFPSETDTFGMVVLEAQACGVPAIVSDYGGPKEIIVDSQTGFVALRNNIDDWIEKLFILIDMKLNNPELFNFMKTEARKNAVKNFNWQKTSEHLFKKSVSTSNAQVHEYEFVINS